MTSNIITSVYRKPESWYIINGEMVKIQYSHIIGTEKIIYTPIDPQSYSDVLCEFPRLVMYFHKDSIIIKVVDNTERCGGWIIGLILGKIDL